MLDWTAITVFFLDLAAPLGVLPNFLAVCTISSPLSLTFSSASIWLAYNLEVTLLSSIFCSYGSKSTIWFKVWLTNIEATWNVLFF